MSAHPATLRPPLDELDMMTRGVDMSDDLVDASTICDGWHPKLPWVTCARAASHRDDPGPMCKGIDAATGDVRTWRWTLQAPVLITDSNPTVSAVVGKVLLTFVADGVEVVVKLTPAAARGLMAAIATECVNADRQEVDDR